MPLNIFIRTFSLPSTFCIRWSVECVKNSKKYWLPRSSVNNRREVAMLFHWHNLPEAPQSTWAPLGNAGKPTERSAGTVFMSRFSSQWGDLDFAPPAQVTWLKSSQNNFRRLHKQAAVLGANKIPYPLALQEEQSWMPFPRFWEIACRLGWPWASLSQASSWNVRKPVVSLFALFNDVLLASFITAFIFLITDENRYQLKQQSGVALGNYMDNIQLQQLSACEPKMGSAGFLRRRASSLLFFHIQDRSIFFLMIEQDPHTSGKILLIKIRLPL